MADASVATIERLVKEATARLDAETAAKIVGMVKKEWFACRPLDKNYVAGALEEFCDQISPMVEQFQADLQDA